NLQMGGREGRGQLLEHTAAECGQRGDGARPHLELRARSLDYAGDRRQSPARHGGDRVVAAPVADGDEAGDAPRARHRCGEYLLPGSRILPGAPATAHSSDFFPATAEGAAGAPRQAQSTLTPPA